MLNIFRASSASRNSCSHTLKRIDERVARAVRVVVESLERRTYFGYFMANPMDEEPLPGAIGTCSIGPTPNPVSTTNMQGPLAVSGQPVEYFDGMPNISSADLSSNEFGVNWGYTRTWTGLNNGSLNGNGWAIAELPYIVVAGGINGTGSGIGGPPEPEYIPSGTENDDRLTVVRGGLDTTTFTVPTSGPYDSYQPWGSGDVRLDWDSTNRLLRLTDSQGNMTEFYDVRRQSDDDPLATDGDRPVPHSLAAEPEEKYGRFKAFIAANGTSRVDADYDLNGNLTNVTISDSASTAEQQYVFSYDTVTNDLVTAAMATTPELITNVKLQQRDDEEDPWATVRQVDYEYYTGRVSGGMSGWENDQNGRLGDLKLAEIKDGDDNVIDTSYYRYYKETGEGNSSVSSMGPTNQHATTGGPDVDVPSYPYNPNSPSFVHRFVMSGIKTIVEGASYDRMTAEVSDIESATDEDISPYANHSFKYERWGDHTSDAAGSNYFWKTTYRAETRYRVSEEVAQGAGCSACTNGQGNYKFEYASERLDYFRDSIPSVAQYGFSTQDYNVWRMRSTEFLPDTTLDTWADNDRNVVYTNELGQPMLEDYVDVGDNPRTTSEASFGYSNEGQLDLALEDHGYQTGDWVAVSGADISLLNVVAQITRVDDDHFYIAIPDSMYEVNDEGGFYTLSIAPVLGQSETYYQYDDQGRLILKAHPSAVLSHFEESHNLLDDPSLPGGELEGLSDDSGYIQRTDYYTTTTANDTLAGGVGGQVWYNWTQRGENGRQKTVSSLTRSGSTATATVSSHGYSVGDIVRITGADSSSSLYNGSFLVTAVTTNTFSFTISTSAPTTSTGSPKAEKPILLSTSKYFEHHGVGPDATLSTADDELVHPIASYTKYALGDQPTVAQTDTSNARTTNYTYTWIANSTQLRSMKAEQPVVSTSHNGAGGTTGNTETTVYDDLGRPEWIQDAAGFITRLEYDEKTGSLSKTIVDVNTALVSGEPSGWTTPSGGGLQLESSTDEFDELGRPTKRTDANGNITYIVYNDAEHEVRTYRGWTGSTTTGPIEISREYRPSASGESVYDERITSSAVPAVSSGRPTGEEVIDSSNIQSLSRAIQNDAGQVVESDRYITLEGITYSRSTLHLGTAGVNYAPTITAYDGRGRIERKVSPTGTITRYVYDGRDQLLSTWIGTDDEATTPYWSPDNTAGTNLVMVSQNEYDDGGYGDGNLTSTTKIPGGSAMNRGTDFYYDWRNRLIATKRGVQGSESTSDQRHPISYTDLDNLGEAIATYQYDGDTISIADSNSDGVPDKPSSALLRGKSTASYDELGRSYERKVYSVDPSSGSVSSNTLTTKTWYDARGNLIKQSVPNAPTTKMAYDGVGRQIFIYTTDAEDNGAEGGGDSVYGDATNVDDDEVVEQTERQYDADSNVIFTISKQRVSGETIRGSLGTPVSTTAAKARIYYTENYYDKANRLTGTTNLGTNGGTVLTSRPDSSQPASSDTKLSTGYEYQTNEFQSVQITGSPTGGTFTLTFAGQTTSGIAYNASASTVQSALVALPNIGSGDVVVTKDATSGVYVIQFQGAFASMNVAQMTAASSLTGGTSPAVVVTTAINGAMGWLSRTTDPRDIATLTDHDLLGRTTRTTEAFTDGISSDADDRITDYTYDGADHVLTMTARLPAGAFQTTQYVYGLTQSSGSDIDANDALKAIKYPDKSTGSASASEQETFTTNALGERTTYADRNGSVHTYSYDVLGRITVDSVTTLGSGVDGALRRLEYTFDSAGRPYQFMTYDDKDGGSGHLTSEIRRLYNGLGQMTTEYQEHSGAVNTSTSPKVQYTYSEMYAGANHSRITGITYPNGREVEYFYESGIDGSDQLDDHISRLHGVTSFSDGHGSIEWIYYDGLSTVVQRAYDGVSGVDGTVRQYLDNDRFGRISEVHSGFGGGGMDDREYSYDRDGNRTSMRNLDTSDHDELYTYDLLNRLATFDRGDLNTGGTALTASPERSQSWSLDALGNWGTVTTDSTPSTRTHNKQNQITSGSLAYDDNGNVTSDENGKTLVYDAWNHLVNFKNGGTSLIAYGYDALGRRITEGSNHLYFSDKWQVIEERNGSGDTKAQYIWSAVYVDALVLRDRDADNSSGNGLEEEVFALQDANYNTVALLDSATGLLEERFDYDPYGAATVMDEDWNVQLSSSYDWRYLHQGGRLDTTTNLYYFRNRDYSATLGRWMEQDPLQYIDGLNSYEFHASNPINFVDPLGLTLQGIKGPREYFKEALNDPNKTFCNAFVDSVQNLLRAAPATPGTSYLGPELGPFLPKSHQFQQKFGISVPVGDGKSDLFDLLQAYSDQNGAAAFDKKLGFSPALAPNQHYNFAHFAGLSIAYSWRGTFLDTANAKILSQIDEDLSQLDAARRNHSKDFAERCAEVTMDVITLQFLEALDKADSKVPTQPTTAPAVAARNAFLRDFDLRGRLCEGKRSCTCEEAEKQLKEMRIHYITQD